MALRGWNLVKPADTYVDDGRTAKAGFLAQRTAFTRLMADAKRGDFDVVVVVDLDRLTRSEDLRERGEVLGAFQQASVQLAISATGQLLDLRSSIGDLMSGLGTFFAAEANRKHRERICRGKDEAIRKGRKPAGPTPFGYVYDREKGEWKVDPELGPIVVEIFIRVAQGETCSSIALDLLRRAFRRPARARLVVGGNVLQGVIMTLPKNVKPTFEMLRKKYTLFAANIPYWRENTRESDALGAPDPPLTCKRRPANFP